jgi:hypothetical protein
MRQISVIENRNQFRQHIMEYPMHDLGIPRRKNENK